MVRAIESCPPGHVEVIATTGLLAADRRPAVPTRRCGWAGVPDVMGNYGERGNAVVLRQRLRIRGIAAEIVEIMLADPVPAGLDLYTLGGARTMRSGWPRGTWSGISGCSRPPRGARRCWRSVRPSRSGSLV